MSRHDDQLASHVRQLGNQELNELLLQLPKTRFAALVEVALARPILPAGLTLRFESVPGVDGQTVMACAPRRRLGTVTRDQGPSGRVMWRAWTDAGDPVQLAGVSRWSRRMDAGTGLAWVTPRSEARFLALGRPRPCPPGRAAPGPAGGPAPGPVRPAAGGCLRLRGHGRMTAVKRCPRCGKVKPADQFYRRQRTRLSSYCRSCQQKAVRRARNRRRQDPAAVDQLRAVDRTRQRRHRALGGHDPCGGDAA